MLCEMGFSLPQAQKANQKHQEWRLIKHGSDFHTGIFPVHDSASRDLDVTHQASTIFFETSQLGEKQVFRSSKFRVNYIF